MVVPYWAQSECVLPEAFMRLFFVVVAVCSLSLSPISAHAAGSSCATGTRLVADGRVLDFDFIGQSAIGWYQFNAVAGRSYSIEVRDDIEDDINEHILLV